MGLGALLAGERSLPLRDVRVRAEIAGDCCRTQVEQRFFNDLEVGMEAVHIFPLPPDGAVTEMELRAGETVVRAECRERAEAERTFDAARRAGHRAGLLTQERADVHTLRVTNLPPKTEVIVRFVVVEHLRSIDGRLRWRFPTVIAPRYMPGDPVGHDGAGVTPDTDQVPDASRISPPLRLSGGTRLDLEVAIHGPVRQVESSLHAVSVGIEDGGGVRVAPSAQATLDRDFVVAFSYGNETTAETLAWTDGEFTLVSIVPPELKTEGAALPRLAVFLLDRSGSMRGNKIDAGRRALKAAIRGLRPEDRFRVVAFDDRIEKYPPDGRPAGPNEVSSALAWIDAIDARGGTEILPALRAGLAEDPGEGRLGTAILITDGQAGNEAELVAAVSGRRGPFRLYTIGIDSAVERLAAPAAGAGGAAGRATCWRRGTTSRRRWSGSRSAWRRRWPTTSPSRAASWPTRGRSACSTGTSRARCSRARRRRWSCAAAPPAGRSSKR